ncbi:MAG: AAA family ATPase [Candidatus Dormibacteria bacterium]
MPDATVLRLVSERLAAQPPAAPGADQIVLSAFDSALPAQQDARPEPKPAYITAIEAEGFRGIGRRVRIDLPAGPGLTLVVGRNGSGKSSIAEALEMLLTGENRRWAQRSRIWTDGWRNLHHPTAAVGATIAVEGARTPRTLRRVWPTGTDLTSARLEVDGHPATLDALGWGDAVITHRPFLSHNELGRILDDGPVKLHDALAGILGLGDITDAQARIRERRLEVERAVKAAIAAAAELRLRCERLDDERAAMCAAALSITPWDLPAIDEALGRTLATVTEHTALNQLRGLATLPQLDRNALRALATQLREVQTEIERSTATAPAVARDTARLLEAAIAVHQPHQSGDCPVCGTPAVLTYEWRMQTTQRITELRERAGAADALHQRATAVRNAAHRALSTAPSVLAKGPDFGIDISVATAAWTRWSTPPESDALPALAAHIERGLSELIPAVAAVRGAAAAELERREDRWRPLAEDVRAWRHLLDTLQPQREELPAVRAAETWMKSAHDALREERFRPIAQAVQENWTTLRQDSNVSLGELRLEGAATHRRLTLDVSVDGEEASALGVMSQGELNCLALSLFLPRAAMPESPFRFLVIDDPVQAMDPAKVEGLARVLQRAATDRQVIVLTHDDRLPDAVRRLEIPATILEVVRREHSSVELRTVSDPVQRALEDALAVAQTPGLPAEAHRVVPGFCRAAIEAACARAITRRLIGEGRSHAEIESTLGEPSTLGDWLALLFLTEVARAREVPEALRNHGVGWAVEAVAECDRGAQSGGGAELLPLIRTVERLCNHITASGRVG